MAMPYVIVSRQVMVQPQARLDLDRAGERQDLQIALDGGQRVQLLAESEKSAAYSHILTSLETLGQPVYLEVDPDNQAIRLLRVPDVGRLTQVRETPKGVEFQIDSSQARFLLPRGDERFDALSGLLEAANRGELPLILTFDDRHEVIDVRPFGPGPDNRPFPDFPFPRPLPRLDWYWLLRWRFWPWNRFFGCISLQQAQTIFDQMSATSCAPLTVPSSCIPFLYPDDGCWARAHEMGRLIIAGGRSPRKVWIQGSLHTLTRNNPVCYVNWGWHVAPTLCVRRQPTWQIWLWGRQTMVIDPSLFTTPVSLSQWKSVQGDPGATLTYTAASDYLWGETDPDYAKTNDRLAFYRLRLMERAVNVGPPPYANCP